MANVCLYNHTLSALPRISSRLARSTLPRLVLLGQGRAKTRHRRSSPLARELTTIHNRSSHGLVSSTSTDLACHLHKNPTVAPTLPRESGTFQWPANKGSTPSIHKYHGISPRGLVQRPRWTDPPHVRVRDAPCPMPRRPVPDFSGPSLSPPMSCSIRLQRACQGQGSQELHHQDAAEFPHRATPGRSRQCRHAPAEEPRPRPAIHVCTMLPRPCQITSLS